MCNHWSRASCFKNRKRPSWAVVALEGIVLLFVAMILHFVTGSTSGKWWNDWNLWHVSLYLFKSTYYFPSAAIIQTDVVTNFLLFVCFNVFSKIQITDTGSARNKCFYIKHVYFFKMLICNFFLQSYFSMPYLSLCKFCSYTFRRVWFLKTKMLKC